MNTRVGPETGITPFFTDDHRACDEAWARVEALIDDDDHDGARAAFRAFDTVTRRHLDLEEQILFPSFEEVTGATGGPTFMMRLEHERMRGLLDQMAAAKDLEALGNLGDTLLMLTQQHNVKEESFLYPLADRALRNHWATIAPRVVERLAP